MYLDIKQLAHLVEERRVAMFCGAGVSIGSGLPSASELKRKVIGTCTDNSEDIDTILRCDVPLEGVFEILSAYTDIVPLLSMFENGTPYIAHHIVGRLVQAKLVIDVGTTNFDPLFERYLRDMAHGTYCLCSADHHTHDPSLPSLFKLHGSVPDYDSIKITLQGVANGRTSAPVINSIRHLFSSGPHDYVLILGYSFSDNFDVNPILRSLGPRKKIVYVRHSSGEREVHLDSRLPTPVQEYEGVTLAVDTDYFLGELWKELARFIGDPDSSPRSRDQLWPDYVTRWGEQISSNPHLAKIIMGRLFSKAGRYEKADVCYGLVPTLTKSIAPVSKSYFLRAGNKINTVEYEEAEKTVAEGLALIPDVEKLIQSGSGADPEMVQAAALGTSYAGIVQMFLGQRVARHAQNISGAMDHYVAAEKYLNQACRLAERTTGGDLAFCILGLGAVHMNHSDCCTSKGEKDFHLGEALKSYRTALRIAVLQGDVYLQADSFDGFGKVFRRQGRIANALRIHLATLKMADDLGDDRRRSVKLLSIALDYQKLPEMATAELEYRREAQPILVKLGDRRTAQENQLRIVFLENQLRISGRVS